jgi:hypothetical protein
VHPKLLTIETESRLGTPLGPRTVYAILLEGRIVGSSEKGRNENPVEGRERGAANIGRAVSRKILAAKTGWNWIGHS